MEMRGRGRRRSISEVRTGCRVSAPSLDLMSYSTALIVFPAVTIVGTASVCGGRVLAVTIRIDNHCAALGIEMSLAKHGAAEADLTRYAEDAHAIRRLMDNNPVDMTLQDVLGIYRHAY